MHARLLLNYIPFLHACLGHDPLFPEIGQLVQGVKRKIPLSDPTSDTDISGCESAILSVTLAQTDPIVSKYGHRAGVVLKHAAVGELKPTSAGLFYSVDGLMSWKGQSLLSAELRSKPGPHKRHASSLPLSCTHSPVTCFI